MQQSQNTIRVVTLNMHKGFSPLNLNSTLQSLKHNVKQLGADIACLQEVQGHHHEFATVPQFEFLADQIWTHYAYGKNAIYSEGHHGNAILSHFPFTFEENINVSNHRYESRGILHGRVAVPSWNSTPLHILTLHFDLTGWGRRRQIETLCQLIQTRIPTDHPVLVCGDFNDWTEQATPVIESQTGLREAFLQHTGSHARTFPARFPFLKLDRIYTRGLAVQSLRRLDGPEWSRLSDHLGLLVEVSPHQRLDTEGSQNSASAMSKDSKN